jgi:PTS system fructose-specific IIC component
MALHAASPAPHGGIWVIGLIGKPLAWLVAIVAGTAVSAACVVVAKGLGRRSLATPGGLTVDSRKVAVAG